MLRVIRKPKPQTVENPKSSVDSGIGPDDNGKVTFLCEGGLAEADQRGFSALSN